MLAKVKFEEEWCLKIVLENRIKVNSIIMFMFNFLCIQVYVVDFEPVDPENAYHSLPISHLISVSDKWKQLIGSKHMLENGIWFSSTIYELISLIRRNVRRSLDLMIMQNP